MTYDETVDMATAVRLFAPAGGRPVCPVGRGRQAEARVAGAHEAAHLALLKKSLTASGDMEDPGDTLRKLAGCLTLEPQHLPLPAPGPASASSTSTSVSWKDLELSCQQLDAAQIRITSLDLSDLDDGGAAGAGQEGIVYSMEAPPALGAVGEGLPWEADGAAPPARGTDQLVGNLQMPPGTGAAACAGTPFLSPGESGVCFVQPGGHRCCSAQQPSNAASGGSKAPKSGSSELQSVSSGLPSAWSLSSTSSSGDILGIMQGDILAPALAASGAPTGIPKAPAASTSAAKGSKKSVQSAPSCVRGREGAEQFETTEKPTRYSSLILPGATPREQRPRGVQKYVHAVRAKCGELFSSTRKAKI